MLQDYLSHLVRMFVEFLIAAFSCLVSLSVGKNVHGIGSEEVNMYNGSTIAPWDDGMHVLVHRCSKTTIFRKLTMSQYFAESFQCTTFP